MTVDRRRILWLHIGLPKTGTSYLQSALRTNRLRLHESGLCYPEAGELGGGHALLAWPLLPEERRAKRDISAYANRVDPEVWSKLSKELSRRPATPILSSEYFSSVPEPSVLHSLCSEMSDTTKVVVYLRRQDQLIESGYNQSVKAGLTDAPFDVERSSRGYDWWQFLKPWEQAFDRENLVVRVYNRETVGRGILEDFARLVGFDASGFTLDAAASNPRLHPDLVEFQRVSNELGYPDSSLAAHISERLDDQTVFLTREERAFVLDRYEESNRRVAHEYLGREDGILFDPVLGDRPASRRELQPRLMVAMIQEIWREVRRLRSDDT